MRIGAPLWGTSAQLALHAAITQSSYPRALLLDELIAALEVVKKAVEQGELDTQIDRLSTTAPSRTPKRETLTLRKPPAT